MQEPFDNIQRVWALKSIVECAHIKYQKICKYNDCESTQSISELMNIVSDATNKISRMRWVDQDSLHHGVAIYVDAIDNL
jgi:hypothetical protein